MPKSNSGRTLENAAGTAQTKAGLAKTTWTDPDPWLVITNDTYERFQLPGSATAARKLLWKAGQKVRTSTFNDKFPAATITSFSPATGAAAGGTAITINGTNLRGSTGAAIGGVAVTSYVVVDDYRATCVTGAHAAGTVTGVITDDSGASAAGGSFVYV
jgi:hypothetical protein